jgi:hypothetical protein
MRILVIGLIALGAVTASIPQAQSQSSARPTMANEADFSRAMKELSNWGRWGNDDELGAANLITPAKRRQALALATEGVPVSLAHDVVQEHAADAPNILERILGPVNPTGTADKYQYTGTYHGIVHSHLDSLDCHMMWTAKATTEWRWNRRCPSPQDRGARSKGRAMTAGRDQIGMGALTSASVQKAV